MKEGKKNSSSSSDCLPCLVARSVHKHFLVFFLPKRVWNFVSCFAITLSCCSRGVVFLLLYAALPFWGIAIYSHRHHDVYNDEMWYGEWWLAQVDGALLVLREKDIKNWREEKCLHRKNKKTDETNTVEEEARASEREKDVMEHTKGV